MEAFAEQFKTARTRIEINGKKRQRAIDAHEEVRGFLEQDAKLCDLGVHAALIGSYARNTGIYPGKDVDIFVKLTKLDTSAEPSEVFDFVREVVEERYGDRAEVQRRSIKIDFDRDRDGFAVDVVPAVRNGNQWALPNGDPDRWKVDDERWITTDPETLGDLTSMRNKNPKFGDTGIYVPTVKLMRQIRSHHRGDRKPGGLFIELHTYWAFERGITGDTWPEVLAATLRSVADAMSSRDPLIDPVLGTEYEPLPGQAELDANARQFHELARRAERALVFEKCPAAAEWRAILGQNERGHCFPLPEDCGEGGIKLTGPTAVAALGGSQASGFG